MTALAWILAAALAALAVVAAVATRVPALDRPVRVAALAAEAVLVVVTVVDLGLVLAADSADRPDSMLTHVGYAVATVGLLPTLVVRRPDDPDVPPEELEVEPLARQCIERAERLVEQQHLRLERE